jgi:hypothetical protein
MPNINLLHVWAHEGHSEGILQFQVIQAQLANLGMRHWNYYSIGILIYINLISIKLQCFDIKVM